MSNRGAWSKPQFDYALAELLNCSVGQSTPLYAAPAAQRMNVVTVAREGLSKLLHSLARAKDDERGLNAAEQAIERLVSYILMNLV